ncbi:MAG: phage protease, partial [bacterium]
MNLILNRDFKMPADGWYQFAPLGEFPHLGADVVQVVDAEACIAMAARFKADAAVDNFAGLLVDFDHFSMDIGQRSEAAGWVTDLESRDTGLWGQIRWSDIGEEAVKGGRYRFLSPVWARTDCVDLGGGRIRPVRMINAALTNDPNLKGLAPLANRIQESESRSQNGDDGTGNSKRPVDFCTSNGGACISAGSEKGAKTMKRVIEALVNHLGVAVDSTEDVILEKMRGLPALAVVTDLQNSLTKALGERDALQLKLTAADEAVVEGHLTEFAAVISNDNREFWKGQLLANRAAALVALKDVLRQKTEGGKAPADGGPGRTPLHNRAAVRPVVPAGDGS